MTNVNIKDFFAKCLATFFYTAFLPLTPASWGSVAALPFAWFLWQLPLRASMPIFLVCVTMAVWSAGHYDRITASHDNRFIVIDEAMGIFLITLGIQQTIWQYSAAFFLFRLFDNWKPFPIRWIDAHISGGLGVVADDLVAALYALLVIALYNTVTPRIHL